MFNEMTLSFTKELFEFAPICRLNAVLPPVKIATPLNWVDVAMRSISA